jgi:hypothetical protein
MREPGSLGNISRAKRIAESWECRAGQISVKTVSTSLLWNLSMFELPGVVEDGMSGRNVSSRQG